MKLKLFTGITLAVALTVGGWLWLRHQPPPAEQLITQPVQPDMASRLVSANAPKMTMVTSRMALVKAASPLASGSRNWSAVHVIADVRASSADRSHAISLLSGDLTDSDWAVLKPFLLQPDDLDRDQPGQVIKNELLDVLCALNPPPAGLGDVLTQMYENQQQDGVIRDYAVQHLAAYYEQMTSQSNSAGTEQAVQNTLWEAVNETSDSIGGTALLGLTRLSQEYTEIDQGKLATTALQMAGDSNAGELTHITAYQVCAQLGTADALPVVLSAAQNGETISVKISAIGALGLLGGPDQIPFLNGLLRGDEARLKPAAQHALDQINVRQNQVASQK